jgi:hypothetical protein
MVRDDARALTDARLFETHARRLLHPEVAEELMLVARRIAASFHIVNFGRADVV